MGHIHKLGNRECRLKDEEHLSKQALTLRNVTEPHYLMESSFHNTKPIARCKNSLQNLIFSVDFMEEH